MYHIRSGFFVPVVVDRFQIDLQLSIASDFTERKTYYGLQNLTQFDMSFKIARQCSDNYYGPQCDVFCSEVEGLFTCDSEGNTVCVNSNLSPETNCTECPEVGQDPDKNCEISEVIQECIPVSGNSMVPMKNVNSLTIYYSFRCGSPIWCHWRSVWLCPPSCRHVHNLCTCGMLLPRTAHARSGVK